MVIYHDNKTWLEILHVRPLLILSESLSPCMREVLEDWLRLNLLYFPSNFWDQAVIYQILKVNYIHLLTLNM